MEILITINLFRIEYSFPKVFRHVSVDQKLVAFKIVYEKFRWTP